MKKINLFLPAAVFSNFIAIFIRADHDPNRAMAGLIQVARGTGGTTITKPLSEITFLDIYRAVECVEDNKLFHFHENPNAACPVGRNIHHVLDEKLDQMCIRDRSSHIT